MPLTTAVGVMVIVSPGQIGPVVWVCQPLPFQLCRQRSSPPCARCRCRGAADRRVSLPLARRRAGDCRMPPVPVVPQSAAAGPVAKRRTRLLCRGRQRRAWPPQSTSPSSISQHPTSMRWIGLILAEGGRFGWGLVGRVPGRGARCARDWVVRGSGRDDCRVWARVEPLAVPSRSALWSGARCLCCLDLRPLRLAHPRRFHDRTSTQRRTIGRRMTASVELLDDVSINVNDNADVC